MTSIQNTAAQHHQKMILQRKIRETKAKLDSRQTAGIGKFFGSYYFSCIEISTAQVSSSIQSCLLLFTFQIQRRTAARVFNKNTQLLIDYTNLCFLYMRNKWLQIYENCHFCQCCLFHTLSCCCLIITTSNHIIIIIIIIIITIVYF